MLNQRWCSSHVLHKDRDGSETMTSVLVSIQEIVPGDARLPHQQPNGHLHRTSLGATRWFGRVSHHSTVAAAPDQRKRTHPCRYEMR